MTAPLTKLGRILRGLDHPEDRCRTVAELRRTLALVRAARPLTAEEAEDAMRLEREMMREGRG